jgi:splicing factor 3B subunit 1
MALDKRNYKQIVETTVVLAEKVGSRDIINHIKSDLKDESEHYRKMVMETLDKVISTLGTSELDTRIEEELMDGALYAYQEQSDEDAGSIIHNGFATIVNGFKLRSKPYLPQICGTIKWRINNKNPKTRQQAANLIASMTSILYTCGEKQLLQHLGQVRKPSNILKFEL